MRRAIACAVIAVAPAVARADSDDLATTRSQIGWGASVNPDHVGLSSEAGWDGGSRHVTADANVEVTLLARLSVFAIASYGGVYDQPRPALGVAYQLVDPRTHAFGVRVSAAYKPEGFTELDGELESVVVVSRRIGRDAARAMFAFGQDPEGAESDAEVGGSFLHRASDHLIVGATARYRRALAIPPGAIEPRWDLVGGGIGGLVLGRTRVELMAGVDDVVFAAAHAGAIGVVSFGTEL